MKNKLYLSLVSILSLIILGLFSPSIYAESITNDDGDSLSLENRTIEGETTSAVLNKGTLEIDKVTFSSNTSTANGGAAIYNAGTINYITNTLFYSNSSTSGGAIFNDTNIGTISGSYVAGTSYVGNDSYVADFYSNTATKNGGAILNYTGTISLIDSVSFALNTAGATGSTGFGGAISNESTIEKISNSYFYANTAKSDGGAIYLYYGAQIGTITTTLFEYNEASNNGGAIYLEGNTAWGDITTLNELSYSTFNYNEAGIAGGAILNAGTITLLSQSSFSYNESAYGGAIANYGTIITLNNSTFTSNKASSLGGAIYNYIGVSIGTIGSVDADSSDIQKTTFTTNSAGYGGAIYNESDITTINDVTFDTNTATYYGGAIMNVKSTMSTVGATITTISASTFTGNTGTYGGAIFNKESEISTITGSTFTSNKATSYNGGAIYNESASIGEISNSTFTGNTASSGGGAIYSGGDSEITTISGTTFDSNIATSFGGAIMNYNTIGTISASIFTGNTGTYGGAIFNKEAEIATITGSTFSSNKATSGNGGAIYNENASIGEISDSSFTSNTANYGAAVYVNSTSEITTLGNDTKNLKLSDEEDDYYSLIFSSNIATYSGGAIYNAGTIGTISNALFYNNDAGSTSSSYYGGAIYNSGTIESIAGSTFSENYAFRGGAIYNSGTIKSTTGSYVVGTDITDDTMSDSDFYYNTSSWGGAIRNAGTITLLDNLSFSKNVSSSSAGAIYNEKNIVTLSDSYFYKNSANNGGAIYNTSTATIDYITNTTFSGNTAAYSGGAIYTEGTINYITGSYIVGTTLTNSDADFYNNTASSTSIGGGAIYATGATIGTISNLSFAYNIATTYGGAIYIAGTSSISKIIDSIFQDNEALTGTGYGGAITINTNAKIELISNTDFVGNDAKFGGAIFSWGTVSEIENSAFSGNTASSSGGAIYNSGTITSISSSSFSGNTATASGGAIYNTSTIGSISGSYVLDSTLTNSDADFYNNTSKSTTLGGGAIYTSSAITSLSNLSFAENTAYKGGAVYVSGAGSITSAISSSIFTGNEATYGGAIINYGTIAKIEDTIFSSNEASSSGGAIYNGGTITSIIDSSFINNSATNGGAIYNGGTLSISSSAGTDANNINAIVNTGNTASYGGFLYAASGSSTTFNTAQYSSITIGAEPTKDTADSIYGTGTIIKSGDGDLIVYSSMASFTGTLQITAGTMYVNNGLDSSYIDVDGGSLYLSNISILSKSSNHSVLVNDAYVSIRDSIFEDNYSSGGYGGAIWNSGTMYISGSTFNENTTSSGGGAIINYYATLTVEDSYFSYNDGVWYGGAIYNYGGSLSVLDSTFEYNGNFDSGGSGGAIYNYAGTATIENSTFTGNQSNEGGAILNSSSSLSITNSIFTKNVSNGDSDGNSGNTGGGAIFSYGDSLTITDTTFTGNYTSSDSEYAHGGAINSEGGTVNFVVSDNTIISNTANYAQAGDSAGGFLYLDAASASFDIGSDGEMLIGYAVGDTNYVANQDSIASSDNTSSITKTGDGTLTVNSSMKYFTGALTVEEGYMEINNDLGASSISVGEDGELTIGASALLSSGISNEGILKLSEGILSQAISNTGTANLTNVTLNSSSLLSGTGSTNLYGNTTASDGLLVEAASSISLYGTLTGDVTISDSTSFSIVLTVDNTILSADYTSDSSAIITGNLSSTEGNLTVSITTGSIYSVIGTTTNIIDGELSNVSFEIDSAYADYFTINENNSITVEDKVVMGSTDADSSENIAEATLSKDSDSGSVALEVTSGNFELDSSATVDVLSSSTNNDSDTALTVTEGGSLDAGTVEANIAVTGGEATVGIVTEGASVTVSEGGTATVETVAGTVSVVGGDATVDTVASGASVELSSGGSATVETVASGASVELSSGGSATVTNIEDGATVSVSGGDLTIAASATEDGDSSEKDVVLSINTTALSGSSGDDDSSVEASSVSATSGSLTLESSSNILLTGGDHALEGDLSLSTTKNTETSTTAVIVSSDNVIGTTDNTDSAALEINSALTISQDSSLTANTDLVLSEGATLEDGATLAINSNLSAIDEDATETTISGTSGTSTETLAIGTSADTDTETDATSLSLNTTVVAENIASVELNGEISSSQDTAIKLSGDETTITGTATIEASTAIEVANDSGSVTLGDGASITATNTALTNTHTGDEGTASAGLNITLAGSASLTGNIVVNSPLTISGTTITGDDETVDGDTEQTGSTLTVVGNITTSEGADSGLDADSSQEDITITDATLYISAGTIDTGTTGDITLSNAGLVTNTVTILSNVIALTDSSSANITDTTVDAKITIDSTSSATISGSTFDGNTSSSVGGAIYNEGTLTITDSEFSNTTVDSASGGAIYNNTTAYLYLGDNISFTNNKATANATYGGAIWNRGTVEIGDYVLFDGNSSVASGGAIANFGELEIGDNATFTNNSGNMGGAIYNGQSIVSYPTYSSGDIKIGDYVTFSSNTATTTGGGAIYLSNKSVTVGDNATFTDNAATSGKGGAIAIATGTSLSLGDGAVFTNNTAATYGGAIWNSGTLIIGDDENTSTYNLSYTGNYVGTYDENTGTIVMNDATASDSAGGFLYQTSGNSTTFDIDANSSITIGIAGADGIGYDSIAGAGEITKEGAGTLTVYSSMASYTGSVSLEEGTFEFSSISDETVITVSEGADLNIIITSANANFEETANSDALISSSNVEFSDTTSYIGVKIYDLYDILGTTTYIADTSYSLELLSDYDVYADSIIFDKTMNTLTVASVLSVSTADTEVEISLTDNNEIEVDVQKGDFALDSGTVTDTNITTATDTSLIIDGATLNVTTGDTASFATTGTMALLNSESTETDAKVYVDSGTVVAGAGVSFDIVENLSITEDSSLEIQGDLNITTTATVGNIDSTLILNNYDIKLDDTSLTLVNTEIKTDTVDIIGTEKTTESIALGTVNVSDEVDIAISLTNADLTGASITMEGTGDLTAISTTTDSTISGTVTATAENADSLTLIETTTGTVILDNASLEAIGNTAITNTHKNTNGLAIILTTSSSVTGNIVANSPLSISANGDVIITEGEGTLAGTYTVTGSTLTVEGNITTENAESGSEDSEDITIEDAILAISNGYIITGEGDIILTTASLLGTSVDITTADITVASGSYFSLDADSTLSANSLTVETGGIASISNLSAVTLSTAISNSGTLSVASTDTVSGFSTGIIQNFGEIGDINISFSNNYISLSTTGDDICIGGAVIYNFESAEIGNITGNFTYNSLSATGASTAEAYGAAIFQHKYSSIGDIEGDFEYNTIRSSDKGYGAAIYNYWYSEIGNITSNFTYNSINADGAAFGGAINNGYSTIGDIEGNFKNNSAVSNSYVAYGGAIYNSTNEYSSASVSVIDSIKGDFSNNYVNASFEANGGAIYNRYSTIGNIEGNFENNYAISINSDANGGAIYNYYSATIGGVAAKITGSFTGNFVRANGDTKGGAIYNEASIIGDIEGNFEYNYVLSLKSSASGGAIYNTASSTISSIEGNFTGNYAVGVSDVKGGAIYNDEASLTLQATTGSYTYIGNFATTQSAVEGVYTPTLDDDANGGFLYNNSGTVNFVIGEDYSIIIGYAIDDEEYAIAYDSIAGTGTITKSGDGTLTVNSSMYYYEGSLYIEEGTMYYNNEAILNLALLDIDEGATFGISLDTLVSSSISSIVNDGAISLSGSNELTSSLSDLTTTYGTIQVGELGSLSAQASYIDEDLTNNGTLTLTGTDETTGSVEVAITGDGSIVIESDNTIYIDAGNLGNDVDNSGILVLGDGDLTVAINDIDAETLTGTVIIAGTVSVDEETGSIATDTLQINEEGTLTIVEGDLAVNTIINNGTLNITEGTLSSDINIENNSDIEVALDALNGNDISNNTDGTITIISSGELVSEITGTGSVVIGESKSGDDALSVSVGEGGSITASDISITENSALSSDASALNVGSISNEGDIILTGSTETDEEGVVTGTGVLSSSINYDSEAEEFSTTGTVTILGDIYADDDVYIGAYTLNVGSSDTETYTDTYSLTANADNLDLRYLVVAENGSLVITGGTLDTEISGDGDFSIEGDSSTDAINLKTDTIVADGSTLTITGNDTGTGSLLVVVTGDVEIDGDITVSQDQSGEVFTLNDGKSYTSKDEDNLVSLSYDEYVLGKDSTLVANLTNDGSNPSDTGISMSASTKGTSYITGNITPQSPYELKAGNVELTGYINTTGKDTDGDGLDDSDFNTSYGAVTLNDDSTLTIIGGSITTGYTIAVEDENALDYGYTSALAASAVNVGTNASLIFDSSNTDSSTYLFNNVGEITNDGSISIINYTKTTGALVYVADEDTIKANDDIETLYSTLALDNEDLLIDSNYDGLVFSYMAIDNFSSQATTANESALADALEDVNSSTTIYADYVVTSTTKLAVEASGLAAYLMNSYSYIAEVDTMLLSNQNAANVNRARAILDKESVSVAMTEAEIVEEATGVVVESEEIAAIKYSNVAQLQVISYLGNKDTSNGVAGYDYYSVGSTANFDKIFSENTIAGLSIGGVYNKVDGDAGDNANSTAFLLNAYAVAKSGIYPFEIFANIGYAHFWNEGSNSISKAEWDSDAFNALAGIAFDIETGIEGLTIKPLTMLNFVALMSDSASYSNGINVDEQDYISAKIMAGLEFEYAMTAQFNATIRAMYAYEMGDESYDYTYGFAKGYFGSIDYLGGESGKHSALIGLSLSYDFSETCSAYFDYNAYIYSELITHSLNLSLGIKF